MRFHHTTLENGLNVVAELNEQAHSVGIGFFVKAGSRDETLPEWGLSHFLEHMIFKGTEKRNALEVNQQLDRIGARHNAQTSEEDTIYHVTLLPEFLDTGFEILADILRPSLRADDFDTEKQVILEEIQMYEDSPMSVAYEKAKDVHFGQHPLGRSVLGTLDSIRSMRLDQMNAYFESRYGPRNVVLAVAGNTDWDRVVRLARSHCGNWVGTRCERSLSNVQGTGGCGSVIRAEDQQMVVVGVSDGPPLESEDRYVASLIGTMLGDHTGSRMYWELIDPGHADGAEVSYQDYNQAGAFYTFVSCIPDEAAANLERIARLFRTFTADGPTESELERARNKVMSRYVLRNERPGARMMSLGMNWLYRNAYYPIEHDLDAYAKVTLSDVCRVLRDWPLWPASVVTVGPGSDRVPVPAR